jgi:hypothetical protein
MKKLAKMSIPLCAAAVLAVGCYEFVSQTVVLNNAPEWTGSGSWSAGGGGGAVVGLAGQDVYWTSGSGVEFYNDPLLDEFGGPYVLTSAAQTHTQGFHERSFFHGNLVGETDNLSLLFTGHFSITNPYEWVDPLYFDFYDGSTLFEVTQICDMAAGGNELYGNPSDPDSHMYLSFKACTPAGSSCTAGVMEISFDNQVAWWWPKSVGGVEQVTVRRATGARFSHECMPISVTRRGDQQTQYLVVGDPSMDELTVFDASSIASGPTDYVYAPDSTRNIVDVTVEGRGDGSVDFGLLVTLWKGSGGARLEHRTIINDEFDAAGVMMYETVPSNVQAIASRGYGAEGTTERLFMFGDQLVRRDYQKE